MRRDSCDWEHSRQRMNIPDHLRLILTVLWKHQLNWQRTAITSCLYGYMCKFLGMLMTYFAVALSAFVQHSSIRILQRSRSSSIFRLTLSLCSLACSKQVLFVVVTHLLTTLALMAVENQQNESETSMMLGAPGSFFCVKPECKCYLGFQKRARDEQCLHD